MTTRQSAAIALPTIQSIDTYAARGKRRPRMIYKRFCCSTAGDVYDGVCCRSSDGRPLTDNDSSRWGLWSFFCADLDRSLLCLTGSQKRFHSAAAQGRHRPWARRRRRRRRRRRGCGNNLLVGMTVRPLTQGSVPTQPVLSSLDWTNRNKPLCWCSAIAPT
jgi:hypothetical protein